LDKILIVPSRDGKHSFACANCWSRTSEISIRILTPFPPYVATWICTNCFSPDYKNGVVKLNRRGAFEWAVGKEPKRAFKLINDYQSDLIRQIAKRIAQPEEWSPAQLEVSFRECAQAEDLFKELGVSDDLFYCLVLAIATCNQVAKSSVDLMFDQMIGLKVIPKISTGSSENLDVFVSLDYLPFERA
jgi:hypothetical protein